MSAEKLLTLEDVAVALLVKPDTLRGWLRTGKIKGVKVGSLWRIWKSELEAFLRAGEEKWQVSERDFEAFLREVDLSHEG